MFGLSISLLFALGSGTLQAFPPYSHSGEMVGALLGPHDCNVVAYSNACGEVLCAGVPACLPGCFADRTHNGGICSGCEMAEFGKASHVLKQTWLKQLMRWSDPTPAPSQHYEQLLEKVTQEKSPTADSPPLSSPSPFSFLFFLLLILRPSFSGRKQPASPFGLLCFLALTIPLARSCEPGYFLPFLSTTCAFCPPGSISTTTDATSCTNCAAGLFSSLDGTECVPCPDDLYPRSSSGALHTSCVLPFSSSPPWSPPPPPSSGPSSISSELSAIRVSTRQSFADLAIAVAWPQLLRSGSDIWDGSGGTLWIVARGGWEEGDEVIAAQVEVGFFDGLRCVMCSVWHEWIGEVGVDGQVSDWSLQDGVRGIVLVDPWKDDWAGLADVALGAAEDEDAAIALRFPLPHGKNTGEYFVAAWSGAAHPWKKLGEPMDWSKWKQQPPHWSNVTALDTTGTLSSEGWTQGFRDPSTFTEPVLSIDSGDAHSCALFSLGRVRCWGWGARGQLGYGNTNNIGGDEHPSTAGFVDVGGPVMSIATGGYISCGILAEGKIKCWGWADVGELGYGNTNSIGDNEVPSSVGFVDVGGEVVQISGGRYHTCALLKAGGTIRCWGSGDGGRLGYGNTNNIGDNEVPSSVGFVDVGGEVVQISAGAFHTCAILKAGGTIRCWGYGGDGQLGYGNTNSIGDDEVPSSVGFVDVGGEAIQISAGDAHTCALLKAGGTIRCWGSGEKGQLGYGNTNSIGDDEVPSSVGFVDVGGDAVHVSAGAFHTCALLRGDIIRCFGWNEYGQVGVAGREDIGDDESLPGSEPLEGLVCEPTASSVSMVSLIPTTPQLVMARESGPAFTPSISVSAGNRHSCALLLGGKTRCWGQNWYGQLGINSFENIGASRVPADFSPIVVGGEVVQISAGAYHTCALLTGGSIRCWGYGGNGNLGYGNTNNIGDDEDPASAQDVNVGGEVVQISAGGYHTCALLRGGNVRCWGYGGNGRLGYGNTNNIGDDEYPSSAGDVEIGGVVTAISAGEEHACVVLALGEVRCWGHSDVYGRLGYGNTNSIGDDEVPSVAGDVDVDVVYGVVDVFLQDDRNVQVINSPPSVVGLAPSYFRNEKIRSITGPETLAPLPALPFSDSSIFFLATTASRISSCPFPSLSTVAFSLVCTFEPFAGSAYASGVVGMSSFTHDSPSSLKPAGGSILRFRGDLSYLAASGGVSDIFVGGRACENPTIDQSTRELACTAPPGLGSDVRVSIVAKSASFLNSDSTSFSLSYLPPRVISFTPILSGALTRPTLLSIFGSNFGHPSVHNASLNTISVVIDFRECSDVEVIGDNEVQCMAPAGVDGSSGVVVQAGQQISNRLSSNSAQDWTPEAVVGWKELEDESRIRVSWLVKKTNVQKLGSAVTFLIQTLKYTGEILTSVSVTSTPGEDEFGSVRAQAANPSMYWSYGAVIVVGIEPVKVRIRAETETGRHSKFSDWSEAIHSTCNTGSFLFNPPSSKTDSEHVCQPCVEGGLCGVGATAATVQPAANYWRADWHDWEGLHEPGFIPCLIDGVCLKGNITRGGAGAGRSAFEAFPDHWTVLEGESVTTYNMTHECALGHRGTLCHQCDTSTHFRSSTGHCEQCGEFGVNLVVFLGSIIGIFLLLLGYILYVAYSIDSMSNVDTASSHRVDIIRLLLAHVQRVSIVMQVTPLVWPGGTGSAWDIAKAISLPGFTESAQCVLGESSSNVLLLASMQGIVIPVALFGLVALFWALWPYCNSRLCCIKPKKDDTSLLWGGAGSFVRHIFIKRLIHSLIVLAMLLHRPITEAGMSLLSCTTLSPVDLRSGDDPSMLKSSRLLVDLDQPCHDIGRELLASTILILGALGIPIALFFVIYTNKERAKARDLDDPWYKQWSLLIESYKPAFYFWNTIDMMRDGLLIMFIVLSSSLGSWVQFLVAAGLTLGDMASVAWFKPHQHEAVDNFAFVATFIAACTFLTGTFVSVASFTKDERISSGTLLAVSSIVVALNVFLVLYGVGVGISHAMSCLRSTFCAPANKKSAGAKASQSSRSLKASSTPSSSPSGAGAGLDMETPEPRFDAANPMREDTAGGKATP